MYKSILIIFLLSCGTKNIENKKEFKFIKNLTFYSGFNSSNSQAETFGGKEYYCVGDFLSYKKIAVHGLTDSTLNFINLKKITDLGEKVISYEIINLDSIYILTDHTNKVFLIDNKGDIKKKYDFNIDTLINKKFMLMRCLTPFVFNDSTFIFGLSYRSQNREYDFNNLEEFQLKRYKAPILYKVTKEKDTIKTELGLENLYLNFIDSSVYASEGRRFAFFEDKIIFVSSFSDSLYIINPENLKIIKKVKISSKYSDIFLKPITVKEFKKDMSSNSVYRTNGRIDEVFYDANKELYFCFVLHKPAKNKEFTSWSIIVLDENFKNIDEIKMDETKYSCFGMMTNEGLLISNYYETINDKDHFKKNTMSLFRYE